MPKHGNPHAVYQKPEHPSWKLLPEQTKKHIIEANRRYAQKTYAQLNFNIEKELVAKFKQKCKDEGISQRDFIRQKIKEFIGEDDYEQE